MQKCNRKVEFCYLELKLHKINHKAAFDQIVLERPNKRKLEFMSVKVEKMKTK